MTGMTAEERHSYSCVSRRGFMGATAAATLSALVGREPQLVRTAAAPPKKKATADAVKGYTIAMRDRPEQLKTLKNFKNPTLFISGEKDGGIPVQTILTQSKLCQHPENHLLQDVAHMGMFEKPEQTAAIIRDFLGKISHFKD